MSDKEKLNFQEKRNIGLEAAISSIPWVGSALATTYFGTIQEKRFKRIEKFYKEFKEEIELKHLAIKAIEKLEEEEFIFILEKLNDKIQIEFRKEKLNSFKSFLIATLTSKRENSFEEKLFFLEVLDSMTLIELDLLNTIYTNRKIMVKHLELKNVDFYLMIGAIEKLKSNGLIKIIDTDTIAGGEHYLVEEASITINGIHFLEYCRDFEK